MNDERSDIYSLEELILCLEFMRDNVGGPIVIPKAIYCLALEIKAIKEKLDKKE